MSGDDLKIYTASKTKHAAIWRRYREQGWPIISTWIDEAGVGETLCFNDLWKRCIKEASAADVTIVYREGEDVLKGAFIEIGAALASGKLVFFVGDPVGCGSFAHYYGVTLFSDLDDAFRRAADRAKGGA